MNLCLSIIKDGLSCESCLPFGDNELTLSRYAFLRAGEELRENILYLAKPDDLMTQLDFPFGSAVLCAGKLPSALSIAALPVLETDSSTDLLAIANEIGAIFDRYNKLELRLNEALLSGGIQELVDIMAPFFVNELSVADSRHMILAHSNDENQTLVMSGMAQAPANMVPLDVINFFKNNKRWIEVKKYTEPFIYDEGIFETRLLCKNIIDQDNKEFVYRVMISETEFPFRSYDERLLVFFTKYVEAVFENTLRGKETYATSGLADVLKMMLSGVNVELWRLQHALAVKGYKDKAEFQCVCIRPSDGDYSSNTVHYYCSLMSRSFQGVAAFEFKSAIICLVNLDFYNGSRELFQEGITPFVRDNNFRAGFSNVFREVTYISDHFNQAEIALNYGISEIPSKWIHKYHEYAMDYIVRQASETSGARALCDERILILFDYDKENGASYIKTMAAYFENKLNALQTSRELGIHRATMIYRLSRIEELSGITFDNAEKNFLYQFSIKLLRYIEDVNPSNY